MWVKTCLLIWCKWHPDLVWLLSSLIAIPSFRTSTRKDPSKLKCKLYFSSCHWHTVNVLQTCRQVLLKGHIQSSALSQGGSGPLVPAEPRPLTRPGEACREAVPAPAGAASRRGAAEEGAACCHLLMAGRKVGSRSAPLPAPAGRGDEARLLSGAEPAENSFSLMPGERGFCMSQPQPRVTACGGSEPQREGRKASGALPEWISQWMTVRVKRADTEIIIFVKQ